MRAFWIAFSSLVLAVPVSAQQPAAAAGTSNGANLVWRQGTVTLHENGTASVLSESLTSHRVNGAFRLVLTHDARIETHYEDGSRLEFQGTSDVTVTPGDGQRADIVFERFTGMAIHSSVMAFQVTLPSAYSFRAHRCFVEGRRAEDGQLVLSNYSGTPLLIYEDGRAVDTLAAGLRGFLRTENTVREAQPATGETARPIARTDDRREWAYRELILPDGVDALPSAGALELVATEEMGQAALVRYGSIYFLMGPASKVTISRAGRVIGAVGAVSLIRTRTDWSQVFGASSPFSPFAGGAGGPLLRSDVSDAGAGSPGSGN